MMAPLLAIVAMCVWLSLEPVLTVVAVRLAGAHVVLLGLGDLLMVPWRGRDRRIGRRGQGFWWQYIWTDRPAGTARRLFVVVAPPAAIVMLAALSAAWLAERGRTSAAQGVIASGLAFLLLTAWGRRRAARSSSGTITARAILKGRRGLPFISTDAVPALRAAKASEAIGDITEACRILVAAADSRPSDLGLQVYCGSVQGEIGDAEGESRLRRVISSVDASHPQYVAAANGLAWWLLATTPADALPTDPHLTEALELARDAATASPGELAILHSYVLALCRTGDFQEAHRLARSLVAELPIDSSGDIGMVFAWSLAGLGDQTAAGNVWMRMNADRSSLARLATPAVWGVTVRDGLG